MPVRLSSTSTVSAADSLPEGLDDVDGALAIDETFHALAESARNTESWPDRGVIYGRLLDACSACHDRMFSTVDY